MGCIVKLTAIVALATSLHINTSSEALAYSTSGLPEAFSGTELFEKHFGNPRADGGIPEEGNTEGAGGRLSTNETQDGMPETTDSAGSR